ncbi:hypothetical protein B0H16DRAFT_1516723 [Mycena metata]|uniref:Uncharacterized protein n=1 Tax=Mycena metata TaxID=1033252 RepID=A0AAD7JSZ9_9AGAR|nr:hypothetical protein B0H16DRAFT_1516723 [Mycena metata]
MSNEGTWIVHCVPSPQSQVRVRRTQFKLKYQVPCIQCTKLHPCTNLAIGSLCKACSVRRVIAIEAATEDIADAESKPDASVADLDDESEVDDGEMSDEVRALRTEKQVAEAFGAIYLQINDIHATASDAQPAVSMMVWRQTSSLIRKMMRLERIFHENS